MKVGIRQTALIAAITLTVGTAQSQETKQICENYDRVFGVWHAKSKAIMFSGDPKKGGGTVKYYDFSVTTTPTVSTSEGAVIDWGPVKPEFVLHGSTFKDNLSWRLRLSLPYTVTLNGRKIDFEPEANEDMNLDCGADGLLNIDDKCVAHSLAMLTRLPELSKKAQPFPLWFGDVVIEDYEPMNRMDSWIETGKEFDIFLFDLDGSIAGKMFTSVVRWQAPTHGLKEATTAVLDHAEAHNIKLQNGECTK